MGWNKKIPPRRMPKTKSAAPPAPTKHTVPCDNFGVRRGGGGVPPPPFGVGSRPGPAPVGGGGSAGGLGGVLVARPGGGGGLRATHHYHMHTSRGCLGAWGYRGMYAIIAISCLCREESLKGLKD